MNSNYYTVPECNVQNATQSDLMQTALQEDQSCRIKRHYWRRDSIRLDPTESALGWVLYSLMNNETIVTISNRHYCCAYSHDSVDSCVVSRHVVDICWFCCYHHSLPLQSDCCGGTYWANDKRIRWASSVYCFAARKAHETKMEVNLTELWRDSSDQTSVLFGLSRCLFAKTAYPKTPSDSVVNYVMRQYISYVCNSIRDTISLTVVT